MAHVSVLLQEIIDALDIQPDDVFLDGTINGGGHSKAVYDKLGETGTLIGIDLDQAGLEKSKERLVGGKARVFLEQSSFRNLDMILEKLETPKVDKILFDLGLSSNQFDESGRGFSFQKEEPLLMTFKNNLSSEDLTAGDIVNKWDEENIAQILESYGEERFAKKIAHAIVFERERRDIETTGDLVAIVRTAIPKRFQSNRLHPATKTFQALRITVNDEIQSLMDGLRKGFEYLSPTGKMAVISFHSLEDRMVKNFFKQKAMEGKGRLLTKKPVIPSEKEIKENPRSRSAKLRVIEKTY